ncbi:MAG: KH domain-containing protein [Firmicutes bacterium]|nr:KH domain-containing protein [Bacillota bacterium]
MIQVIEHIIKCLVENKDAVKLTEQTDGDNVTVTVHVGEGDMGRVIGKQGSTVTAIRTILKNANAPDGKRYFIQIGDRKEGGAPRQY